MKLLNCQIVNFGCLSNCSFTFDEGLNLLYAPNGQGKSTFAVFLKAMLYGLPGINKRALIESERKRYMPWQGGAFGGALCFEADGVEYRLERFFGEKEREDRFALYHLATGNPSDKYTENIGEELFGVDADGFERSLYISQRLPFLPPDNNSILAKLGSLLDASEDLGKFENADKLLDDVRRHYRAQGDRGLIPELIESIREKEAEITAAQTAQATAEALRTERAAIEEKKAEVATALEEAKAKRTAAEARLRWEEQNASYTALCEARDKEKSRLIPLEDFFTPHMPADEELFAADRLVTECTTLSAQIDSASLTAEEQNVLASMRAKYGDAVPGCAHMEKMRASLSSWRRSKDKLYALKSQAEGQKDPAFAHFASKAPTDAEQAGIRAAAEALEEAENELYTAQPKKNDNKALQFALLVLSGIFAIVTVLGFAFSLLPVAIIALVLCFASAALFLVRRTAHPQNTSRQFENCRILQDRLSYLLSAFGYSDKNASLAASRFFNDLARYESLCKEQEQSRSLLEEATKEEAAKREALIALLGTHGSKDPEGAAAQMEADVSLFAHLLQKESDTAVQKSRLTAEKEDCSAKLSAFLAHFPSVSTLSPRDALDTIKQNLSLCRQTLSRFNDARNRVAEYLASTRFDPEAPPTPYAGDMRVLVENEAALQKAYTELESLSSVKENETRHQSEIASCLSAKQAERESLLAEKSAAEHTLSLILLTKEVLKEAKEDLSTRYLRDMELHFDRYYQKMTEGVVAKMPADGSRISKFTMDTSLSLSTETYGERRPVSVLSRGECDLIAFCARLSLMESIFTQETPFLLLDDPFINLDDDNYKKATDLLSFLAERFQIIYTVCSQARLPATVPIKTL